MSQDREASKRLRSSRDEDFPSSKPSSARNQSQEAAGLIATPSNTSMKTQTKLVASLHSAANEGKVELVRLLLRCGANVNSQDEQYGNTALHQAAWHGFSQTVQVLCKYRANTSIKNKNQFTPLHLACQQGHNQTARLLLMANAKTEAKNSYGDTPLHTAARYGHAGVARILLSASCNPNQVNKNHDTPLHIAAAMGRRKLTKIFMQNGAEPAIKNKQNETAMDIALRKDLIDIQELIANPPPVRSARQRRTAFKSELKQTGVQLAMEQRYGAGQQLYGRLASGSRRRTEAGGKHHKHASSEEEELSSELGPARCAGSGKRLQRNWHGVELAVDVPGDDNQEAKARLVSRANRFSSLHSLSAKLQAQHEPPQHRRLRTKTLVAGSSGAELHLLPALALQRRERANNKAPDNKEACLLPDALDSANEWADMMAESALGRVSAGSHPPAVIEASSGKKATSRRGGKLRAGSLKPSSPTGSLRSSLSKSQGRLLVRQQRQKCSLLVRRPNLGTCVGKLSLLRLRASKRNNEQPAEEPELNQQASERDGAEEEGQGEQQEDKDKRQLDTDANKCHLTPEAEEESPEREREATKTANKDGSANSVTAASRTGEKEQSSKQRPLVAAGRRQERLERCSGVPSGAAKAPNGTPLLVTRPLAALNDDSQLYAIPKKSKTKQQVLAGKENSANEQRIVSELKNKDKETGIAEQSGRLSAQQPPARSSSGGPALTSDGGLSSSAGSSASSFARAQASPSSSSNIASSSDDCIESMDIVCVGKRTNSSAPANKIQTNSAMIRDDKLVHRRPAVVGVHADGDLYNVAPGYSVIGEQRPPLPGGAKSVLVDMDKPCLCQPNKLVDVARLNEPLKQLAKESSQNNELSQQQHKQANGSRANGEQQPSKTSRLRQLLHLETRTKNSAAGATTHKAAASIKVSTETDPSSAHKVSMSAIAGGYYAYSPVVQSSSELQQQQHVAKEAKHEEPNQADAEQTARPVGAKTGSSKKSWLMSKFSLSSSNIHHESRSDADNIKNTDLRKREQPATNGLPDAASADKESVSSSSALLGPPERKAELINVAPIDLHQSQGHLAAAECSEGAPPRLIRPKSALSATSADLIAAQKSLAAAAAAKVRRDRMVRIISTSSNGAAEAVPLGADLAKVPAQQQQQHSPTEPAASKEGVLTVKTSDQFWSHHHTVEQPMLVPGGSGGPNYMLAEHRHHRSGTNSVGMSDSSPSNNGADSDNSIQTTTGSLATDNTSGGQPVSNDQTHLSPLGILSRILLNNKSISTSYSSQASANSKHLAQEADSSGLSSAKDGAKKCLPAAGKSANQKLDQLTSRSRCPIVATNSNGSADSDQRQHLNKVDAVNKISASDDGCAPPPLPAKSALKTSNNTNNKVVSSEAGNNHLGFSRALIESMNGLPRVSSYNQISTGTYTKYPLASVNQVAEREQQLCNYHAMSRNQPQPTLGVSSLIPPIRSTAQQTYYPPASGYHNQATASSRYLCESGKSYPLSSHMSQHDLRLYGAPSDQSALDLTLPASAINYEYYLDSAAHLPASAYQHQSLLHPAPARYHYNPNDTSIYPPPNNAGQHFTTFDDSIYIPYVNANPLLRDTSSSNPVGLCGQRNNSANKPPSSYLNFRHHPDPQQQQRPKSSLDSILLSSVNSAESNRRRLSVSNNNQPVADNMLHDHRLGNQHPAAYPATGPKHPVYYSSQQTSVYHSSPYAQSQNGYLYPESSVYAGDQSSERFHLKSDLTVLPTTPTPTSVAVDSSSSGSSGSSSSPYYNQQQQEHQQHQEDATQNQLSGGGKGSSSASSSPSSLSVPVSIAQNNGVAQVLSHQSQQTRPNLAQTSIDRVAGAENGKQVARSNGQPLKANEDRQKQLADQKLNSWMSTPYKSLVQVNQTSSSYQSSGKSNQSSAAANSAPHQLTRLNGDRADISSITVTNGAADSNHRRSPAISSNSKKLNSAGSLKTIISNVNGKLSSTNTKMTSHLQTKALINSNKSSLTIVDKHQSDDGSEQSDSPSSVRILEECNGSTVL